MKLLEIAHLHGLLLYRSTYYKVRSAVGPEFNESVAGTLMGVIEKEIDEALKPIDINSIYKVLAVPYKRWPRHK